MTLAQREPAAQRVAIVIPVHNRRAFTRTCLEHLSRQTVQRFQVVVIDDGSSDGTGDMIHSEFPEVVVLRGDGHLWWTGATNLGVTWALHRGFGYILTLNDDTLPGPGFVESMLAAARKVPGALIGAYSVDAGTGRPIFGGEHTNWITAFDHNLLDDAANGRSGLLQVSHYAGRGLLIPAEVFRRIGLFDSKHFPHYLADYDFTHHANRRGYPIFCSYASVLDIYPGASGNAANRERKCLENYRRHLFHMKGGANLAVFFWFAVRNCPKRLLPFYLTMGLARRIFGYLAEWLHEACTTWWERNAYPRT